MDLDVSFTLKGLKLITTCFPFVVILYLFIQLFVIYNANSILFLIPIFLLFILGILGLIGLIYIFKGKKEFGEKHENSMKIAGRLLIIEFVIFYFISIFLGGALNSAEYVILTIMIYSILGIISSLFIIYLIKDLADGRTKKILWYILPTAFISSVIANWIYYNNYSNNIKLIAITLIIIPGMLIFYCYRKTYLHLKALKNERL